MTRNALKMISTAMKALGLEYGFVRYAKHPIVYPYCRTGRCPPPAGD